MQEQLKSDLRKPFLTVQIDPKNIFESEAVTDPAELAELDREHKEDRLERVIFLGVFESEAITDPAELAKYHRTASHDRSPPILVDKVDEFIESEGNAIIDPAELARLRPQVDRARKNS